MAAQESTPGTAGKIQQQNVGPDNEAGSGEWPHPATPPTGPAPGTDPTERERMETEREQPDPPFFSDRPA